MSIAYPMAVFTLRAGCSWSSAQEALYLCPSDPLCRVRYLAPPPASSSSDFRCRAATKKAPPTRHIRADAGAEPQGPFSSARRSPPSKRSAKPPHHQSSKKKNAHDAKRPRRPRRRLGPPRPQPLLGGSAERRAGAHRAGGASMHSSWLRRPGLRPAAADDRALIKRLRPHQPLHQKVMRPHVAAAHDRALIKPVRPLRPVH